MAVRCSGSPSFVTRHRTFHFPESARVTASGSTARRGVTPGLNALEDRRDPLTAADAERREPVLALSLAELGDERERETRTGRAERMAKRDRAAVHVRLLAIEAKLLLDGEVLCRERFVDLDEIHVLDLETGALQRLPARRCGAD